MNATAEVFLAAGLGTALLLFGWSFYRFGIRAIGFLIGAAIGASLGYSLVTLLATTQPSIQPYAIWIALGMALLLGLLNMRIVMKVYYLLVFAVGAIYGAHLKIHWFDTLPPASGWLDRLGVLGESPWAEILFGLIAGILCVIFQRYLVILLTTLMGGVLIVSVLHPKWHWAFPILVLVGILSQIGFLRIFHIRPKSYRLGKERKLRP